MRVRTDLGNAELFVREHAHELRYVGAWGKWLVWTGQRWELDSSGRAEHIAQETVRNMFSRAAEEYRLANLKGDPDQQKAAQQALGWAMQSHKARAIAAMLSLARSAPKLSVSHTDLDRDPWAFNVTNGTIDLRTGKLRKHNPGALITKLAPVVYDPDAKAERWEKFLAVAMGRDAELIGFLRRMAGYALTGVIREHVLAFLHGDGANGKSTWINAMHTLLGDYGVRAPRHLLFETRGDRHETELTTLFGARFVSCAEIKKGSTFDDATVKDLTGGDQVTARRMREDHWSFAPTHKLFLAGNHKPNVRGDDEGIWRRIRLVPWSVTIPEGERDTELPTKLAAELPGILAWAVRGCLEWQRVGLAAPSMVQSATATYREESDPLKEFCDLYLVFGDEHRVPRKHVRGAYEEYCRENGAEPLGACSA